MTEKLIRTGTSLLPDNERPPFSEPWEAQIFSLVLELHRQGAFSWSDWAARLSSEIAAAKQRGETDREDTYYCFWLAALETLLVEKSLMSEPELNNRVDQWRRAYLNTPHGQPIDLAAGLL